MCVYSNILDHFKPIIPHPFDPKPIPTTPDPFQPNPLLTEPTVLWNPPISIEELRKTLAQFKEAMEAAKKVDEVLGHPDCEQPDKLQLLDRIAELEKRIAQLTAKVYVIKFMAHKEQSFYLLRMLNGELGITYLRPLAAEFETKQDAMKARAEWLLKMGMSPRVKSYGNHQGKIYSRKKKR